MKADQITLRMSEKIKALNSQLQGFESRLTSVSRATQQATSAVTAAGKAVQAVATLLDFDEINRLKEKTSGSSSSKKGSSKDSEKVKTGPTEDYGLDLELKRPLKGDAAKFWSQFELGFQKVDVDGEEAGGNLVQRVAKGISNALGNVTNWVSEHLWTPIKNGWNSLGSVGVTVAAGLSTTAGELWSNFQSAWQNGGTRAVEIWNTLTNGASTLWQEFSMLWGTRGVGIVNTLTNAATTLWQQFSMLWGIRGVGIVNTLTNAATTLWQQFSALWGTRGVGIVNTLTSAATTLWQNFAAGWGTRSVSIVNSLLNAAATLWQRFASGWGTRSVSIVNTLTNSAASLWERFRSGWAGRTLSLTVTYSTNVSAIKRAVYKALGLSGWPTISFAARGGVFQNPTLTMLGEAGTEAVVPLENNTGWMDVMAEKLGERMGATGTIVVPVYIGGDKVAEKVVEAVNAETRRTGVNPLYI